jgi:hypothetical protein
MKRNKEHDETNLQHSRDRIGNLQIACINSFNVKNSLTVSSQKSPAFISSFCDVFIQNLPLGSEEPNYSICPNPFFKKVPDAGFCLDLIHMIHLSKK